MTAAWKRTENTSQYVRSREKLWFEFGGSRTCNDIWLINFLDYCKKKNMKILDYNVKKLYHTCMSNPDGESHSNRKMDNAET